MSTRTVGEVMTDDEYIKSVFDRIQSRTHPLTPEEIAKSDAIHLKRIEKSIRDRIEMYMSGSNAPERHLACSVIQKGRWGEELSKLKSKIGTGFSAALIGGRGNGKTQMAVELMRYAAEMSRTSLYTTAIGFFMAIKSTYKKEADKTEEEIVTRFSKPKLLVIDEVGRRGETDWENNLLFELLNRRYAALKDTILICNQTAAEFSAGIGPSIISRMNESGGIIQCDWPSFR